MVAYSVTLISPPGSRPLLFPRIRPVERFDGVGDLLGRFTIKAAFSGTKWKNSELDKPLECSLVREKGVTGFTRERTTPFRVFCSMTAAFRFRRPRFARFIPCGRFDREFDNQCLGRGLSWDLPALWPWLGLNILSFSSGTIDGNFSASGLLYDPEFTGA
jgi:hypothetical protein